MISETLTDLVGSRGEAHGDFAEKAATVQALKEVVRTALEHRNSHDERVQIPPFIVEMLDSMIVKMGRVLHGDWREPDHVLDMAGYAWIAYTELLRTQQKH